MDSKLNTLNPDEIETDDIYQSAYFMVAGCEFKRRRKVGNKVYFVFSNPAGDMKDMRERYFMGGKVNALDYANAIKRSKEMCFLE